jgi:hypothetical protein
VAFEEKTMKSLFIAFLALFLVLPSAEAAKPRKKAKAAFSKTKKSSQAKRKLSKERQLYVGKDSTEAIMTFNGTVEVAGRPSQEAALEKINEQIEHLYGPMSAAQYKSVPRGNHKITNVKVTPMSNGNSKVTYSYSGTIVLQNGPTSTYEIILPVNPDKIYKAGMINRTNPCTDHHYQEEGDFWYFWNPANPGCRLQKNKDFFTISANIKRVTNTQLTFPEYERLVDQNGNITVSLLMGMDDPNQNRDPNSSGDINASNFRDIKETLKSMGYQGRVWTSNEINAIAKKPTRKGVYVEEFLKQVGRVKILLRVFFGPSGIDEDSSSFHYFFKDALENQAVMMYDGHSGLGGHLDLESIEEEIGALRPNQNRYQIYYFNSCTSYSYYNTMYFDRKKSAQDPNGTKNLDIFTNGLATYFSVMHDTNLALIKAIESYASGSAKISYQSLAKSIDSDNLFGINGDEDNPTK